MPKNVALALVVLLISYLSATAEIRVAIVGPLTGDFASYGTEIQQGAQLAVDELNKRTGAEHVTLIAEDACLPATTVSAANKLTNIDHIDAVVGGYCVVGMIPMVPKFEAAHVIAFHSSAVPSSLLDAGEYIFSTNVSINNEAGQAAAYARLTLGVRTAAIMYVNTQWGEEYRDGFKKRFEELGGKVVSEIDLPIASADYRSELLRVKAAKPNLVFIAHVGPTIGNVLKQARTLGISLPVIGPHEAAEPIVAQTGGKAAEGLTVFAPALPKTAARAEFENAFSARFKRAPGLLASNAFDATHLAVSALRSCKDHDGACAKEIIYRTKDYAGVSGTFSVTEQGGTQKPFVRKVLVNGAFVEQ